MVDLTRYFQFRFFSSFLGGRYLLLGHLFGRSFTSLECSGCLENVCSLGRFFPGTRHHFYFRHFTGVLYWHCFFFFVNYFNGKPQALQFFNQYLKRFRYAGLENVLVLDYRFVSLGSTTYII